MRTKTLDQLVNEVDEALEAVYVARANGEHDAPEDIYYVAEEALDAGIGGVLVHTASGSLKWFSLEDLVF